MVSDGLAGDSVVGSWEGILNRDSLTWLSFVSVRDPSAVLLPDFLNALLLLLLLPLAVVALLFLSLASAFELPFRLGTADMVSPAFRQG